MNDMETLSSSSSDIHVTPEAKPATQPDLHDLVDRNMAFSDRITLIRTISETGLPTSQIRQVGEGFSSSWDTLSGRLTLPREAGRMNQEEVAGQTLYGVGLSLNPLEAVNADVYGSETAQAEAAKFATDAARQSLLTDVFVSGRHREVAEQAVRGELSQSEFVAATNACLIEARYANPDALREVQAAQRSRLAELKKAGEVDENFRGVTLVSEANAVEPAGIDKTIAVVSNTPTVDGIEKRGQTLYHRNPQDQFELAA